MKNLEVSFARYLSAFPPLRARPKSRHVLHPSLSSSSPHNRRAPPAAVRLERKSTHLNPVAACVPLPALVYIQTKQFADDNMWRAGSSIIRRVVASLCWGRWKCCNRFELGRQGIDQLFNLIRNPLPIFRDPGAQPKYPADHRLCYTYPTIS